MSINQTALNSRRNAMKMALGAFAGAAGFVLSINPGVANTESHITLLRRKKQQEQAARARTRNGKSGQQPRGDGPKAPGWKNGR